MQVAHDKAAAGRSNSPSTVCLCQTWHYGRSHHNRYRTQALNRQGYGRHMRPECRPCAGTRVAQRTSSSKRRLCRPRSSSEIESTVANKEISISRVDTGHYLASEIIKQKRSSSANSKRKDLSISILFVCMGHLS